MKRLSLFKPYPPAPSAPSARPSIHQKQTVSRMTMDSVPQDGFSLSSAKTQKSVQFGVISQTLPPELKSEETLVKSAERKLETYAHCLLNTINDGSPLRQGQPLKIKASSEAIPLLVPLIKSAYRDFQSGFVSIHKITPELEALKKKYKADRDEFKLPFQKMTDEAFSPKSGQSQDAFMDLTQLKLKEAALTKPEIEAIQYQIHPKFDNATQKALNLNTDEILNECLKLQANQPLYISGHREHLPQMLRLAETALKQGPRPIHFNIKEYHDLNTPFYQFNKNQELFKYFTDEFMQQKYDLANEKMARISLTPEEDPNRLASLSSEEKQKVQENRQQHITSFETDFNQYYEKEGINLTKSYQIQREEVQWNVYYLPTTFSYPQSGYASLEDAALEAKEITRVGQLKNHIKNLQKLRDKVNEKIKEGYRILRFKSEDGSTDLKVGLSTYSRFLGGTMTTLNTGITFLPNIPTEEVYTTPDWTKTSGKVTTTLPFNFNGVTIPQMSIEFKDGKIARDEENNLKIKGKNTESLIEAINKTDGMDQLGEVALVANSPIFKIIQKRDKPFNNILLDENAACHIALGSSYNFALEGYAAASNNDERNAILSNAKANKSTEHRDMMIGGPDVTVTFEKEGESPETITLIKNDQFVLD